MAKFSWRSLSAYCGGSRDANDAFSKKIRECPLQATLKGAGQPRTLCPRVCLSLNSAGECTDTTAASSARASHAKVCSVAVTPFNRQTHDGTRTSSTAFGRVFCPEASRSRPFPTSALTLACAGRGSFRFVSSTRTSLLTFSSPLGLLSSPVAACSKSSSSPTVQVHPSSLSLSVQFPPGQPNETASLQPVAKRFLSGGHNNKKKKKDKASSKDEGKKEEKRLRRVLRVIGGGGLDHGEDFDEAPSSQPHGGGGRGMEDGSGRHRHAPSSPTPPHSERRARESSRHEQEEAEEDRHSGRRGEKPSFDLKAYERNMAAAIDSMVQKMKALLSTRERILDFEKILVAVAGKWPALTQYKYGYLRACCRYAHFHTSIHVPADEGRRRLTAALWLQTGTGTSRPEVFPCSGVSCLFEPLSSVTTTVVCALRVCGVGV